MNIEHGTIEGDLEITEEFTLHGLVTGNITVKNGGIFYLHGFCSGDLTIEEGATVYLHGMCGGKVFSQGGNLEIYGMVGGGYGQIQTIEPNRAEDEN